MAIFFIYFAGATLSPPAYSIHGVGEGKGLSVSIEPVSRSTSYTLSFADSLGEAVTKTVYEAEIDSSSSLLVNFIL